jgi:hypothetical protein
MGEFKVITPATWVATGKSKSECQRSGCDHEVVTNEPQMLDRGDPCQNGFVGSWNSCLELTNNSIGDIVGTTQIRCLTKGCDYDIEHTTAARNIYYQELWNQWAYSGQDVHHGELSPKGPVSHTHPRVVEFETHYSPKFSEKGKTPCFRPDMYDAARAKAEAEVRIMCP